MDEITKLRSVVIGMQDQISSASTSEGSDSNEQRRHQNGRPKVRKANQNIDRRNRETEVQVLKRRAEEWWKEICVLEGWNSNKLVLYGEPKDNKWIAKILPDAGVGTRAIVKIFTDKDI